MSYLHLDLIFLAVAGAVGIAAVVTTQRRRPRAGRRHLAAAISVTAAVTLLLTAIFDNIMIAIGLFTYENDRLLGATVGLVPVEDFAYPLAAAVLLPSLWVLTGRRSETHE